MRRRRRVRRGRRVRRMTTTVRVPAGLRGVGVGWRPEIAGVFAELPGLGFTEVVAENLQRADGTVAVPDTLAAVVARGVPCIPHGIGLSLGGAEPVNRGGCATSQTAPSR